MNSTGQPTYSGIAGEVRRGSENSLVGNRLVRHLLLCKAGSGLPRAVGKALLLDLGRAAVRLRRGLLIAPGFPAFLICRVSNALANHVAFRCGLLMALEPSIGVVVGPALRRLPMLINCVQSLRNVTVLLIAGNVSLMLGLKLIPKSGMSARGFFGLAAEIGGRGSRGFEIGKRRVEVVQLPRRQYGHVQGLRRVRRHRKRG